ncbi:MAG TPA: DUF177 domain-containing protein [Bryobacteraceae bacterium]|nr:DUF177 domain-containing protein [Bryobacteraceae bacterium]
MFLSVKEMELRKIRFDEIFQPGQVDFSDAEVRQVSPLHAIGTAELLANTEGEVRIQGSFAVEMGCECDRCLGQARFPLEAPFDLFYRPMSRIARVEEVEIDEGEAEIAFYEGGGMELEDVLREQVILALPMQRTCREDCQGICPNCGTNRNETVCECRPDSGDDRWKPLSSLQ